VAPALVTLDVWGVPRRGVPAAMARMALDRRSLRTQPGLSFAKLLGTGSGQTFTVRDADPRHWALLTAWSTPEDRAAFDASRTAAAWARLAEEHWRADLAPVSSRGRWSGQEPFDAARPARPDTAAEVGSVVAITRARLVPAQAVRFWRSVPPVSADLQRSPGLRFALGIGEAPIGLQGTFSVWRDAAALREFAYQRSPHQKAIADTAALGWYAEELFARFRLLSAVGTYLGRDPLC
jgi:hypothetical protein